MAHNEEAVIVEHVRNLRALDYPRDLYDVVVVADNCTDGTAELAADEGALVWRRKNIKQRGKGHALRWALYERSDVCDYDAVCVLDADNLCAPNFLREMALQLADGHEVIQAYLDSKNPRDSWVAASYASAYWFMNRFRRRARLPGAAIADAPPTIGASLAAPAVGGRVSSPLLRSGVRSGGRPGLQNRCWGVGPSRVGSIPMPLRQAAPASTPRPRHPL
jgi:glycosyltransferase involved in cell wall biosynthesis